MTNKYLREFRKLKGDILYPNYANFQEQKIVFDLISKYAWAIPNDEAIKEISKFGAIIEIGAGNGYWASLIKKTGCRIIAYDNKSTHQLPNNKKWYEVLDGSYEKIKSFPNHTLFLCWLPYENDLAINCLKTYKGDYLLYVGEELEGSLYYEDFFNEIFENWTLTKTIDIPSFGGVYDSLFIYKRKMKKIVKK